MSTETTTKPIADELTLRDFALHDAFLKALIADEALQDELPNGAALILLPDDDPELTERNIAFGVLSARRGRNVYLRHVHRASEQESEADAP